MQHHLMFLFIFVLCLPIVVAVAVSAVYVCECFFSRFVIHTPLYLPVSASQCSWRQQKQQHYHHPTNNGTVMAQELTFSIRTMCVFSIFAQFARYCIGKCSRIHPHSCVVSFFLSLSHSFVTLVSVSVCLLFLTSLVDPSAFYHFIFNLHCIELSIYLFLPGKLTNLRL